MLGCSICFAEAIVSLELTNAAPVINEKVMYRTPPGDVKMVVLVVLVPEAKVYTSLASGVVPTLMRNPDAPALT
jgi:hypothetical protein